MNAPFRNAPAASRLSDLVRDDPAAGVFELDRTAFTDEAVFEAEMRGIFEATWVFVGLESQIRNPHDFITAFIGRHPVLLMRDGAGNIGCFLNTCRHRGTIVCPFRKGQRKLHVCRYHGWSYDSAGRCVAVTEREAGQYPESFDSSSHDLIRVAKLASYRGFLFASLDPDVPPLDVHLGDARTFLDLVVDQSDSGELEFVSGGRHLHLRWQLETAVRERPRLLSLRDDT